MSGGAGAGKQGRSLRSRAYNFATLPLREGGSHAVRFGFCGADAARQHFDRRCLLIRLGELWGAHVALAVLLGGFRTGNSPAAWCGPEDANAVSTGYTVYNTGCKAQLQSTSCRGCSTVSYATMCQSFAPSLPWGASPAHQGACNPSVRSRRLQGPRILATE